MIDNVIEGVLFSLEELDALRSETHKQYEEYIRLKKRLCNDIRTYVERLCMSIYGRPVRSEMRKKGGIFVAFPVGFFYFTIPMYNYNLAPERHNCEINTIRIYCDNAETEFTVIFRGTSPQHPEEHYAGSIYNEDYPELDIDSLFKVSEYLRELLSRYGNFATRLSELIEYNRRLK